LPVHRELHAENKSSEIQRKRDNYSCCFDATDRPRRIRRIENSKALTLHRVVVVVVVVVILAVRRALSALTRFNVFKMVARMVNIDG